MDNSGTVLIVEDDADVQRAARIALTPHVQRIEFSTTTADLEQQLRTVTPDVVLLDMNFVFGEHTGREGLGALARIQGEDPDVAVVLMTAYGGVALAVEALKQGAVDFILKPWRNDKLAAAVLAAMKLTQSRRAAQTLDLDTLERGAIAQALARHEGNISLAATTLGVTRQALYRRMSKYGL
jgi:DNA-binding NtrC family response regulator